MSGKRIISARRLGNNPDILLLDIEGRDFADIFRAGLFEGTHGSHNIYP